jgi:hypothetical protein
VIRSVSFSIGSIHYILRSVHDLKRLYKRAILWCPQSFSESNTSQLVLELRSNHPLLHYCAILFPLFSSATRFHPRRVQIGNKSRRVGTLDLRIASEDFERSDYFLTSERLRWLCPNRFRAGCVFHYPGRQMRSGNRLKLMGGFHLQVCAQGGVLALHNAPGLLQNWVVGPALVGL